MKIGHLNDTHLGITSDGQLEKCFRELAEHKPDLLIHCGDYCGGKVGAKTLRVTCELMRKYFDVPILSVMGNHDFWCGNYPPFMDFHKNYDDVLKAFKANQIHFLDEDGIYRKDNVTVMGCTGWYLFRPESNDWKFMPKYIHGDTHFYLQKRATDILDRYLAELPPKTEGEVRIFVSHFAVKDCFPWDGNPRIGELLDFEYGFDYFLSGHSHCEMKGPKHFRTKTDYGHIGLPHYGILEVA